MDENFVNQVKHTRSILSNSNGQYLMTLVALVQWLDHDNKILPAQQELDLVWNLGFLPRSQAIAALYEDEDEDCTMYQATAGLSCGCENPLASVGACRICGGDIILPVSTRVVVLAEGFDFDATACGKAKFLANLAWSKLFGLSGRIF